MLHGVSNPSPTTAAASMSLQKHRRRFTRLVLPQPSVLQGPTCLPAVRAKYDKLRLCVDLHSSTAIETLPATFSSRHRSSADLLHDKALGA